VLRELVASTGEFQFDEAQRVELKGLAGEHVVHRVRWDAVDGGAPTVTARGEAQR